MTVTKVCRLYIGLTQQELADRVGIHTHLVCDIEKAPPSPIGDGYKLVADYLGLPYDAVLQNDFAAIPENFFDHWPTPEYTSEPTEAHKRIGREGEEFILQQEQNRVAAQYPTLARLVMPLFKMPGKFGYDILSFDDAAHPICIEVKTSIHCSAANGMSLTSKELRVAQNCTMAGEHYLLCSLTNWGKPGQRRRDIPFAQLMSDYEAEYTGVRFRKKARTTSYVSGIAYNRKRKGLNQTQLAALIGTQQGAVCLYENGKRTPSLNVLRRLSAALDVTIDELIRTYEVSENG